MIFTSSIDSYRSINTLISAASYILEFTVIRCVIAYIVDAFAKMVHIYVLMILCSLYQPPLSTFTRKFM